VKPSLFKNELLATSDALNTWVFEGLWCIADREGRLEDRPRRIHLEINPGRAYETTETALAWLAEHGFIVRYTHGSGQYIQVVNFGKHQNPHMREPASVIAAPGVSTEQAPDIATHIYGSESDSSTGPAPVPNGAGPALSPSLIPLSPSPLPESSKAAARPAEPEFAEFRAMYPERNGNQPWNRAKRAITARLMDGHTWEEILSGTRRYADWCLATGKLNTETVMQAATFCGPEKAFLKPWTPPASKADVRMVSNIDAAAEAKRRIFGGST
jgi:hypothetical protein